MITTWGSWSEFQDLLQVLRVIADKYKVDVSNVAARWVLDHSEVGAVIVGTRLGVSSNVASNLKTFSFNLNDNDRLQLSKIVSAEKGRALYEKIGDCGNEYRH
jgi:aryl-alcohol dehydrogenase-like predicted oxidoreductase